MQGVLSIMRTPTSATVCTMTDDPDLPDRVIAANRKKMIPQVRFEMQNRTLRADAVSLHYVHTNVCNRRRAVVELDHHLHGRQCIPRHAVSPSSSKVCKAFDGYSNDNPPRTNKVASIAFCRRWPVDARRAT